LREALFNILQTRIAGATFMDVYAGTGAVGIEALSRGAARAIFLERNRAALEAIRENLQALGLMGRGLVVAGPALQTVTQYPADIVFMDPPYALEREYRAALDILGEAPPPLVVVQHSVRFHLEDEYGALRRTRSVRQSDNALSFFGPA
jgi:16S rRNA (guanine966-N2)-methyltransferase